MPYLKLALGVVVAQSFPTMPVERAAATATACCTEPDCSPGEGVIAQSWPRGHSNNSGPSACR